MGINCLVKGEYFALDYFYVFIIYLINLKRYEETIEYIDESHFLLGVQFHPEDLDNTEALYNYFLKEVYKRKH